MLRPGGIFVNADQVLGPTASLEMMYRNDWLMKVRDKGVSDEKLAQAQDRMRADKMCPLDVQLEFFNKAGFDHYDCAYKNFSFAVTWGQKV